MRLLAVVHEVESESGRQATTSKDSTYRCFWGENILVISGDGFNDANLVLGC